MPHLRSRTSILSLNSLTRFSINWAVGEYAMQENGTLLNPSTAVPSLVFLLLGHHRIEPNVCQGMRNTLTVHDSFSICLKPHLAAPKGGSHTLETPLLSWPSPPKLLAIYISLIILQQCWCPRKPVGSSIANVYNSFFPGDVVAVESWPGKRDFV